jgi:hypothetical protein
MVQAVLSDDGAVQLEATTQFRKLLSIGETYISLTSLDDICLSWSIRDGIKMILGLIVYRTNSVRTWSVVDLFFVESRLPCIYES